MTTGKDLEYLLEARNRSIVGQGTIMLLAVVVAALPALPGVGSYLRVKVSDAVVALLPFVVVSLAAAVIFHRKGLDATYNRVRLLESWAVGWTICSLLYASGSAHSVFWVFYFAHLTALGVGVESRQNSYGVLVVCPSLLALAFLARYGSVASAASSLVVAGVGAAVFATIRSASDSVRERLVTEVQLRSEIADLEVQREQEQLALPLHRELQQRLLFTRTVLESLSSHDGIPSRGVKRLLERLDGALMELDAATVALEGDVRPWPRIVDDLQARLEGLGGSCQLELVDTTTRAPDRIAPRRAIDLERAVLEATRNAVRHARAERVQVRVCADQQLHAEVQDDGTGLPEECLTRQEGGLFNLGRRAALAGGRLDVLSAGTGTRIVFDIPLV